MKLSVVSTLYMSSPHVREFVERAAQQARQLAGDSFEIILVNDGSPDDSLDVAVGLLDRIPELKIIDLARNFGHHQAMLAGLNKASGDRVFLLDSDLEEQPEWLEGFAAKMNDEACDVVFGVQARRKGGWFERLSGALYFSLFNFFTGLKQQSNFVTARLMSRRYVDALLLHTEREINIGGLWHVTGFRQLGQPVNKLSSSQTSYSFTKKFGHVLNGVTSFSNKPLYFIFYVGLAIFVTSLMFIALLAIRYFTAASPPPGYVSVIASIWMFSGLLILFIGIQSIYLAKIFAEVKRRPVSIVRTIYEREDRS